ncbi:MAG: hypothetical protein FWD89_03955 [Firmicutes bacterium]|nr:hypothetical protein [Bacillota bacterium]
MPLTKGKCTNCGGVVEFDGKKEHGWCPYCETKYVKEDIISNYYSNQTFHVGEATFSVGERAENLYERAKEFQAVDNLEKIKEYAERVLDVDINHKGAKELLENPLGEYYLNVSLHHVRSYVEPGDVFSGYLGYVTEMHILYKANETHNLDFGKDASFRIHKYKTRLIIATDSDVYLLMFVPSPNKDVVVDIVFNEELFEFEISKHNCKDILFMRMHDKEKSKLIRATINKQRKKKELADKKQKEGTCEIEKAIKFMEEKISGDEIKRLN